ncbi:hypothetical protein DFH11DRAFT_997132 [Phellopilus nigrolimitatus]|nr:hypothetical protein DFH11DRAFT_997132 [Phellopilus nigrolimitatus]
MQFYRILPPNASIYPTDFTLHINSIKYAVYQLESSLPARPQQPHPLIQQRSNIATHLDDTGFRNFNFPDYRVPPVSRATHQVQPAFRRTGKAVKNHRPCYSCQNRKKKCNLISMSPTLCERCQEAGLRTCHPHPNFTMSNLVRRADNEIGAEKGLDELRPQPCTENQDQLSGTLNPYASTSSVEAATAATDANIKAQQKDDIPHVPTASIKQEGCVESVAERLY